MSLHNAPPVAYPLGRSYFLGALLLGLWLAGGLLALFWYQSTRQFDWRLGVVLAAVLLAGVAAGIGWKNVLNGRLAWDGEVWRWEAASGPAGMAVHELSVVADFQSCLLLRLQHQAGASSWLWAEQGAMPALWLDLRRAVYSPHRFSGALPLHDLLSQSSPVPASAVAVSTALHSIEVVSPKP